MIFLSELDTARNKLEDFCNVCGKLNQKEQIHELCNGITNLTERLVFLDLQNRAAEIMDIVTELNQLTETTDDAMEKFTRVGEKIDVSSDIMNKVEIAAIMIKELLVGRVLCDAETHGPGKGE